MSGHVQPADAPARRGWVRLALGSAERLVALSLGLLLLRSAFVHLGNPYLFLSTVYSYQLTGIEVGKWTAIVLPTLQAVFAVCLLARWWLPEAYFLTAFLFLAFVTAHALVLRQGLKITCGCFGAGESLQVGRASIALAAGAAAFALFGCAVTAWRGKRSGPPAEETSCTLPDAGPA